MYLTDDFVLIKIVDMQGTCSIIKTGKVDVHFKNWLECNFGFYTCGVLVDSVWDSNIIYQYDPELDALKSSYNIVSLSEMYRYELETRENRVYLHLFIDEENLWCSYIMMWLDETAPKYFWDKVKFIYKNT